MRRADLSDLAAFAAIAARGSFRRAATDLGVSTSALSHALTGLEARMGVRLLHRTTRSVAPTEAGAVLLSRLGPALAEIDTAMNAAGAFRETVGGSLRINAPRSACRLVLIPMLTRFLARYPSVRIEITSDDALTDVVAAGYDAGVRVGEHLAQDMIAVPIGGPLRFALVASPGYLATRNPPATPAELVDHSCLRQRFPGGSIYRWEFERAGREIVVAVDGPLILDDQGIIVQAARDGHGIAFVFEAYAAEAVASGTLVRLLPDWCPSFPGFHLYYAGRRQIPPALRAFVELLRAELGLTEQDLTATP